MDDGELDFSNQDVFSTSNIGDLPGGGSMDSFLDEILKDTHACTHTHTCHPPGPDYSHTHTCFHVHTKIVSGPSEEKISTDDTAESSEKKPKKRPLGNREAVRKYREKKKARAASLEDEVERLRALNQQLVKRLQGQAALEAEIARLKCLLVDIRGRIEGEIGSFPYQRSDRSGDIYQNAATLNFPGAYVMNPCNMQFDDQAYCRHPGMDGKSGEAGSLNGQGFSGCEFENLQCLGSQGAGLKERPSCGLGNVSSTVNSSGAKKRRDCTAGGNWREMQLAQPHTHSLTVHVKAQIEAVTISEIHQTYSLSLSLSLSLMVLNTKTSILCLELRPVQRKGKEKRNKYFYVRIKMHV